MPTKVKNGQLAKKFNELMGRMPMALNEALREEFKIEVSTRYNVAIDTLVCVRSDGRDFTKSQVAFIAAWEKGYIDAMGVVHKL